MTNGKKGPSLEDMTQPTSMRLSHYTIHQLAELEELFGMTRTGVVSLIIDRMWRAEVAPKKDGEHAPK